MGGRRENWQMEEARDLLFSKRCDAFSEKRTRGTRSLVLVCLFVYFVCFVCSTCLFSCFCTSSCECTALWPVRLGMPSHPAACCPVLFSTASALASRSFSLVFLFETCRHTLAGPICTGPLCVSRTRASAPHPSHLSPSPRRRMFHARSGDVPLRSHRRGNPARLTTAVRCTGRACVHTHLHVTAPSPYQDRGVNR